MYHAFNLRMRRSPGFGSHTHNFRPLKTRVRFACACVLRLAVHMYSLTHYAKGTPCVSDCMSHGGVQNLFHSLVQGSFHLSLTVLVRYREKDRWGDKRVVPLSSHRMRPMVRMSLHRSYWAVTIYCTSFQMFSTFVPRSLATTNGLSVDVCSYSY